MTTDANNQQPPEEPTYPVMLPPNQTFPTQRRPWRMTQERHPDHKAMLQLLDAKETTRYIALDVSAETLGAPAADRDGAIESLYDRLGYDGKDGYTGTIVVLEAAGTAFLMMALNWINFKPGYLRLQDYRPDLAAKRHDAAAADIDESKRKH